MLATGLWKVIGVTTTPNATIRYTLDGSRPTAQSPIMPPFVQGKGGIDLAWPGPAVQVNIKVSKCLFILLIFLTHLVHLSISSIALGRKFVSFRAHRRRLRPECSPPSPTVRTVRCVIDMLCIRFSCYECTALPRVAWKHSHWMLLLARTMHATIWLVLAFRALDQLFNGMGPP